MATRTKKNVKDSNANAEVKTEAAEVVAEAKPKKTVRRRPVKKQQPQAQASEAQPKEQPVKAQPKEQPVKAQPKEPMKKPQAAEPQPKQQPDVQVQIIPEPLPLPNITIHNIIELQQAPMRAIILSDAQIQVLSMDEIIKRHKFLQETLANVLDYDVVISDTNVWLELLFGKAPSGQTAAGGDAKPAAQPQRLLYERQLEFISKMCAYRGGRFMMMSETYEEIDRFACLLDPQNYKDADFSDNSVCLNAAARLAKRLILQQQRENRLRIDGIGAESHHASFADPAIVRRVTELFAEGKKVLLLTNDASVAIRTMGVCDDLQRYNNISDEEWNRLYAPLRPMVFMFEDLRLLESYTRQYHFIQMASGQPWMCDVEPAMHREKVAPLTMCDEAFVPGDKRKTDNLFPERLFQSRVVADPPAVKEASAHKSAPKPEQKPRPKRHRPQKVVKS